jgi:hypothetical protein
MRTLKSNGCKGCSATKCKETGLLSLTILYGRYAERQMGASKYIPVNKELSNDDMLIAD